MKIIDDMMIIANLNCKR